jgi:transcriptional regulator with XRE-family HTH domain
MPATVAIQKRLREWRKANRILLKDLAAKVGVSMSTVSAWETGVRFPTGRHLDRLAELMKMPACTLFYHGKRGCPHGGWPERAAGAC